MEKKVKLKIRKGDMVIIMSGESKGKQGKVLSVVKESNRAIVEGVNQVSKHSKPNAKNTQGGIVKQEASIHMSNMMLVDPKTGKPTRVGRKVEDGKIVRYAKKSGDLIKENK
ncbi:MAG: 50S ribosomal protein L24 [Bacteroidia bacterium]|nr:50S ribosomal protein L24 [Bacteroidia bacterium]HOZ91111.1 50S ribosomal protein L24 [Bacteroidia bacterium]HQV00540.1 50S ribosomal protein L24 [Bacteroidia bacterium]